MAIHNKCEEYQMAISDLRSEKAFGPKESAGSKNDHYDFLLLQKAKMVVNTQNDECAEPDKHCLG